MLKACRLDIYFLAGDSERFHQINGVIISSVGCAETGHCDADNIGQRSAELFDRLNAHEQSKG